MSSSRKGDGSWEKQSTVHTATEHFLYHRGSHSVLGKGRGLSLTEPASLDPSTREARVMVVNLRLFAIAKQHAGKATIELELPDAATVADLKQALASAVPSLGALVPRIRIAINSEYASDGTPIPMDSELAAIPPVSGG